MMSIYCRMIRNLRWTYVTFSFFYIFFFRKTNPHRTSMKLLVSRKPWTSNYLNRIIHFVSFSYPSPKTTTLTLNNISLVARELKSLEHWPKIPHLAPICRPNRSSILPSIHRSIVSRGTSLATDINQSSSSSDVNAQYFVRLENIRKCFTQKGGTFVLEEFSKWMFHWFNQFCCVRLTAGALIDRHDKRD